ncbi:hypothetical protein Tco_1450349, partial [Tanacetum coccineum]
DEFPGTDNDTTDNASSDEDTIQESQSPNSKKFSVRKVESGAAKGKGKEKKYEMEPDHDVVKVDSILGSLI